MAIAKKNHDEEMSPPQSLMNAHSAGSVESLFAQLGSTPSVEQEPTVTMTVKIPASLQRKIRLYAAEHNKKVYAIVTDALHQFFEKNKDLT